MMRNVIVWIAFVLLMSSCARKNLMDYYYPINNEVETKVYKYVNPKDISLTEYWKVTTNPSGLTMTESFDSEYKLYNVFEEKVSNDSAELIGYTDYERGLGLKEISAIVKRSQVFSSNRTESYSYAVTYTNQYGRFIFEKDRQFDVTKDIVVQGETYKVAAFNDAYSINAIDQNEQYGFTQVTYYASGIGMVKYERFIPDLEKRVLELEQILSIEEFDALRM